MKNGGIQYLAIIGVNLIYACVSIFSKKASEYPFLSLQYCLWFAGALFVMGIYALCWQQIIRKVEISLAYMFKGTSIIFVMLLAYFLFNEQVTLSNIIGAFIIVIGIVLYTNNTESVEK